MTLQSTFQKKLLLYVLVFYYRKRLVDFAYLQINIDTSCWHIFRELTVVQNSSITFFHRTWSNVRVIFVINTCMHEKVIRRCKHVIEKETPTEPLYVFCYTKPVICYILEIVLMSYAYKCMCANTCNPITITTQPNHNNHATQS